MSLKNVFLIILLSVLTWGCTPMARVRVATFPAGGTVVVDENGRMVRHGGKLSLEAGNYTLVAKKAGYYDGRLKFTSDGWTAKQVTVPLGGKKPVLSLLTVRTDPPGGTVRVVKTARDIADGGGVKLAAGRYTLRAAKAHYRDNSIKVDLDGEHPQAVTVPLGPGYATVAVAATPAGAVAAFDNDPPLSLPLKHRMNAGFHKVKVSRDDYYRAVKNFEVKPGKPLDLRFELKKIPTTGHVLIKTEPAGASIIFNNKVRGHGRADLGWLKFAAYKVRGVRNIDKLNRLVGTKSFTVKKSREYRIVLELSRREMLYQGKWLPAGKAAALETSRYQGERVVNPVRVTFDPDKASAMILQQGRQLAGHLMAIMRVGDSLVCNHDGHTFTIWKRHRRITPEFRLAVEALLGRGQAPAARLPEKGCRQVRLRPGKNPLAELAFALHRARSPYPLIDLTGGQLARDGETVYRTVADGPLTLIALGGKGLQVPDAAREEFNGLVICRLAANDRPVKVNWHRVPARLLVVSDKAAAMVDPPVGVVLKSREKHLQDLVKNLEVKELVRLSSGPDYQGWWRQKFTATGPFAGQINLSRDEIGPQDKSGSYQRTWLVRYKDGSGISQRQLHAAYEVSDIIKQTGSGRFLREGTDHDR